jgi:hypothetical protein
MASTNTMLKQCAGLVDTKDVTDWQNGFLKSVLERSENGSRPDLLSDKQLEVLESIHSRHFA